MGMEYFFTFALLLLVYFTIIGGLVIIGLAIIVVGQKNKKENSQIFLIETTQASVKQEDSNKSLINNHTRRLHKLKEIQALYGLNTPAGLLLEIEDIEAKIKQLQTSIPLAPTLILPAVGSDDKSNDRK
jgi:histidine ammonia-lyase